MTRATEVTNLTSTATTSAGAVESGQSGVTVWDGVMAEAVAHLLSGYAAIEELMWQPLQSSTVAGLFEAARGVYGALAALDESSASALENSSTSVTWPRREARVSLLASSFHCIYGQ
jgi:hypothetical protein